MPAATYAYKYWRDLDGLRGVAVLCVVLAHAQIPFTSGGGLAGVTAFFVLSGFLITRLLLVEHQRWAKIDLAAFYARRALRLLPALLVLVGASAAVYGLQGRIDVIITSGPPVLLYSANWVSAFHGPISPFQHTWSLAIEEQFYLLWPISLLAILAVASGARAGGRWSPLRIAIAALCGFALWRVIVWFSTHNYDRTYYGFDTNAFALLVGCVIALAADRELDPKRGRLLSLGGLVVMLAALPLPSIVKLSQDGVLFLPSLLSAAGAAAIVAGRGMDTFVLANPLIVWLGRISYGVYLWHWVVPRMAAPIVPEPGRLLLVAFAATAVAIAAVSFKLVEQPALRLKARWSRSGETPAPASGDAATG